VYFKTTANAQNIQKGFSLSMPSTKPQPVIGVVWRINAVIGMERVEGGW